MIDPARPFRWTPQRLIHAHLAMFGVGMILLGLSQALTPQRWDIPIYHVTYQLLGRPVWAVLFLVVGSLKLASIRWEPLTLAALATGSAIVAWWAVTFVIATFTDSRFPPTGAVAWLWLLGGHLGAATLYQQQRRRWGRGVSGIARAD